MSHSNSLTTLSPLWLNDFLQFFKGTAAMNGAYVSKTESIRFQVVSEFNAGKLLRREASELLGVSERTVSRISRRVKSEGVMGVKHANIGCTPVRKTPEELKVKVLKLVRETYRDFNMSHALEVLRAKHGIEISYTTFRRWCHESKMVKHVRRKRRSPKKIRTRMPRQGLFLQMDGSHHKFNGKDEWVLIAAIDDATSEIPYAEFFKGETTLNCMKVLKKIIEKKVEIFKTVDFGVKMPELKTM